jgi:hypothetical protein
MAEAEILAALDWDSPFANISLKHTDILFKQEARQALAPLLDLHFTLPKNKKTIQAGRGPINK